MATRIVVYMNTECDTEDHIRETLRPEDIEEYIIVEFRSMTFDAWTKSDIRKWFDVIMYDCSILGAIPIFHSIPGEYSMVLYEIAFEYGQSSHFTLLDGEELPLPFGFLDYKHEVRRHIEGNVYIESSDEWHMEMFLKRILSKPFEFIRCTDGRFVVNVIEEPGYFMIKVPSIGGYDRGHQH